jgi:hypothetical protein
MPKTAPVELLLLMSHAMGDPATVALLQVDRGNNN